GRLDRSEDVESGSAALLDPRRHDDDCRRPGARPRARRVRLPRQARGPQPPGRCAGSPPRGARGVGLGGIGMAKILLVEDNEMNRDMLSRRLSKRGYEVLIAQDGGEGLAMARSQS